MIRRPARLRPALPERVSLVSPSDGGLLWSANSLLVGSAVAAVLGAVFWIVAARLFSAEEVGRDAALIAAMVELSTICQLNLDNGLVRFLPSIRAGTRRVLAAAYAANTVLALALGTAFVLVVPSLVDELAFLRDDVPVAVAFVAGLALWGIFTLQDAALAALRHAVVVPVESAVFGVLKLAALPVATWIAVGHGVFLAWIVPMALLVVPINVVVFGRAARRHVAGPPVAGEDAVRWRGRRHVSAFMAQDYAGQVLMRLGVTLLPILVVATLGPEDNAYFYVPFTIVIAVDMMFLSIATSVVAEAAREPGRAADHLRTVVRRYGPLLGAAVAALVVAAPIALLPFGTDYAREGDVVLRVLAVACIPRAAVFLAGAVWRLEGRGGRLLAVEALMLVVLLGSVVPLADGIGLTGVALAWLASAGAAGAVAAAGLARPLRSGLGRPADSLSTNQE